MNDRKAKKIFGFQPCGPAGWQRRLVLMGAVGLMCFGFNPAMANPWDDPQPAPQAQPLQDPLDAQKEQAPQVQQKKIASQPAPAGKPDEESDAPAETPRHAPPAPGIPLSAVAAQQAARMARPHVDGVASQYLGVHWAAEGRQ